MIHVTRNEGSTIYYRCDCGTMGLCTIKPQDEDAAIVIDVRCPNCSEIERMVLLQYSSEEKKEILEKSLNETEFKWSCITKNEIIKDM